MMASVHVEEMTTSQDTDFCQKNDQCQVTSQLVAGHPLC